ncbi:MAG: response regulator transcription factor, partial [Tannerella sp.]|nr:response regulator transcription factor [Tannerella sp.]
FRFAELAARIRALLRRPAEEMPPAPSCGDLQLFADEHRAQRDGRNIDLSLRECCLLDCLMRHAGKTLRREDIIRAVWEKEPGRNMNIVDVYVNYLRAKIDKDFEHKLIHTVPGVGYRLEA